MVLASAFLPIPPVPWTSQPLAVFLKPLVVVADGLDADERVAVETDCSDGPRILEAWYDEHDLRNRSWEQVVASSFACPL